MPGTAAVRASAPPPQRKPHKLIEWPILICGALALFYGTALTFFWPFTKQDLTNVLQERSLRQVTIGKFDETFFPPGCVAEQIRFLRIKHKDRPPLLTIRKLVVQDSYLSLLTFRHKLSRVDVIGLHVSVPMDGEPQEEGQNEPSPMMPLTYSSKKGSFPVDLIVANNALLDFYGDRLHTLRYRIFVRSLMLRGVSPATPLQYNVVLSLSKPAGVVRSEGSWGPWNPKEAGRTPAHGRFTLENANLSDFQFLSGVVRGDGNFRGTMEDLYATGVARARDFAFKHTSHKRDVEASFEASINAENGGVWLNSVIAKFNRSTVGFRGGVQHASISMDLFSKESHIEDLMDLFISSAEPPFTGNIAFAGHADVPDGSGPFLRRMLLRGGFGMNQAEFTNPQTRLELDRLSASASKTDVQNPATALSNLAGIVDTSNGIAHFRSMSFEIPGATATLSGAFGLLHQRTDLHGVLRTTGDISDTTTGVKSFLLKLLSPLLKRQDHRKVIAFRIEGNFGHTTASMDLGKSLK